MEIKEIESRLKLVMNECGIADYFFCGIDLEGVHIIGYAAGMNKDNYSNTERRQRLIGVIEEAKASVILAGRRPCDHRENYEE
jgi:hypothetical protein